ncbi:hypothetical protein [Nocardioides sp. CFH 31398]|uniref:hypothetical protein n=1 Tax=Nocardioides sp. CFH 31398 TaxID=2919579 RepID=UPI001F06EF32|nr:hypothetical protein [Nocardioides sp. CFH 31398]MCH1867066.1 hypothetical protein [Nocardioides sp. CFH 31398]
MTLTGAVLFEAREIAEAEVNRLCGGNELLLGDALIGRIVEKAADSRHTFAHDIETSGGPVEVGHVRVLPAHRSFGARRVPEPDAEQRCGVWTMCDRCDQHHNTRNGRKVWVPAGPAAIEFGLCLVCVDHLNEHFGPVTWRS